VNDCLFCRINSGEIPAETIFEDEHVLGFKDINPQAPQHLLFIPRKHISTLTDAHETDAELLGTVTMAAKKYLASENISSYRLVWNCGTDAGQTVYHIHLHALAGRGLGWPPG
jgi:histidine triad (HIT) family protein